MSSSTSELRVRLAPLNRFKPSSQIFYWPSQDGTSFVDLLCFFCLVFAMPLWASVYLCLVVTCWERADILALVCGVQLWDFITFPLVSWVRCGTWLYRFLIFAPLLTFQGRGSDPLLPSLDPTTKYSYYYYPYECLYYSFYKVTAEVLIKCHHICQTIQLPFPIWLYSFVLNTQILKRRMLTFATDFISNFDYILF